jgi:hypothetical protein
MDAALDASREARRMLGQLARDNPAMLYLHFARDLADFAIGDLVSTVGRFAASEQAIEDVERIIGIDPASTYMRFELADAEISMAKALAVPPRHWPLSAGHELS